MQDLDMVAEGMNVWNHVGGRLSVSLAGAEAAGALPWQNGWKMVHGL